MRVFAAHFTAYYYCAFLLRIPAEHFYCIFSCVFFCILLLRLYCILFFVPDVSLLGIAGGLFPELLLIPGTAGAYPSGNCRGLIPGTTRGLIPGIRAFTESCLWIHPIFSFYCNSLVALGVDDLLHGLDRSHSYRLHYLTEHGSGLALTSWTPLRFLSAWNTSWRLATFQKTMLGIWYPSLREGLFQSSRRMSTHGHRSSQSPYRK